MSKTTTYLLGMLITILVGTYFYITFCSECAASNSIDKEVPETVITTPTVPEATSYPFAFKTEGYDYNTNDNYNFNMSSSSILLPLSPKVTAGITSLKSYLAENTDKVINVTGFYKSDEANKSVFPNLGLARANAIKNNLAEHGISSLLINTTGELMDSMVPDDYVFLGPISYNLHEKAENVEDDLKALHDKIIANPLVLYFETGEAAINLTPEQRQKVADISRYLDKTEGAKAKVVGHTDSSGNRLNNIKLGQGRADFVMGYLIKNGIIADKIVASSDGPDSPVVSNKTPEGKSKNRRTVVTLNK